MDASALESRIKRLENSSDSLGFWLMIMTLLVVIGLVVEYWREVPECIAKLREARRWLWQPLCILAGALLITLGVAGEMVFEFLGSANSDALRRANDEVLANMKKQTADANERASYANERTEKLRASIAGRDLSEEQQRNIGVILAKYSGRTVWLRSYRADGEAKRLGVEIKRALASAHITVEDRLEQMYSDGPLLFGIEVTCAESAVRNQRAFAKDIISALSAKETGRLSVLPLSEFACPSDEITEIHVESGHRQRMPMGP